MAIDDLVAVVVGAAKESADSVSAILRGRWGEFKAMLTVDEIDDLTIQTLASKVRARLTVNAGQGGSEHGFSTRLGRVISAPTVVRDYTQTKISVPTNTIYYSTRDGRTLSLAEFSVGDWDWLIFKLKALRGGVDKRLQAAELTRSTLVKFNALTINDLPTNARAILDTKVWGEIAGKPAEGKEILQEI